MKPRITVSLAENGEFEIYMNEPGRDVLVKELQGLSRTSDHVHLGPDGLGDIEVSTTPYRPTDKVLDWGKLMLRPDDWDREFYPHVFGPTGSPTSD